MTILRMSLILGLLSAVGPFAIDMYLPAMPQLAASLGVDETAAQLTLTSYFIAFGLAQLIYGPWSDQAGRKVPLFAGLAVFIAGSAICAVAPTIGWLVAGRAVQGIGGAVLMVVPRAVIRDMHTGTAATRMMATVMLVISVSPMLAPLAGAGLIQFGDWRLIFWVLCAAAVVAVLIAGFALPETLPQARRQPVHVGTLLAGSKVLLRDPVFMGLTFIGGFGTASFFVFIASASFVYVEQFGLSPTGFSLAFAVNAVGFFAATQAAGAMGERFGVVPLMRWGVIGFAVFTVALLLLTLAGFATFLTIVVMLFLANACLGLVVPTTMVMALDAHGRIAGLASSLGGTLQMVAGGVVIALTGLFFDGTALPMVAAIALCALSALVLALLTLGRVARSQAQPV
ncbi:MFS transporter, DHA1 family, bicyclomycin/chloramphenicol resistance protein [Loktanella fryxellensis]|uniref:Bcr/CflA family efflux transporter n=1 Tax=Loktanella fryxellensis TaxID=245187 RepID=A0A1H8BIW7_9RHOB|nr:multidrug effflux MFS transporter [Loktanella fryxellensis]SEM81817.1 MFS transporter, DHA1 family, bicyclomycin/chloramphenicol resistance protein [Loktanella fryxellensis]